MKRYKSPYLENEKRTNPDSDRRKQKRRGGNIEPIWGELIKELGPEIKDFLLTTAESHQRMTDVAQRRASAEESISESIVGLVEHFKTEIKVMTVLPERKKLKKNNDRHHQEVKRII